VTKRECSKRWNTRRFETLDDLHMIAGVDHNNESIDANTKDNDDNMLDIIEVTTNYLRPCKLLITKLKTSGTWREGNHIHPQSTTFERDLEDNDNKYGLLPWLQDDEFLQKYQMHRESFHKLLPVIKDHPVFQTDGAKNQAPVAHQPLVLGSILAKADMVLIIPPCEIYLKSVGESPQNLKKDALKQSVLYVIHKFIGRIVKNNQ
jgi:hypothetical protein